MVAISNIHNASPWLPNTAYALGGRVNNDAAPVKAYECTVAGTSAAAGGPVGTGATIVDGGATWKFLSNVDFTSIAAWYASLPPTLTDAVEGHLWRDNIYLNTPELTGVITSATFPVTITAAPGESFVDHPKAKTNPLRYNPDVGVSVEADSTAITAALFFRNFNTNISRLQIKTSSYSPYTYGVRLLEQQNLNYLVEQCIIDATMTCIAAMSYWGGTNIVNINNLFVFRGGNDQAGISISRGGGTSEGNTFVRPVDLGTFGGKAVGGSYFWTGAAFRNNITFGFLEPLPASMPGGGSFDPDGHNATDAPAMVGTTVGDLVNLPFDNTTFVEPISAAGLDLRPAPNSPVVDMGTSVVAVVGKAVDIIGVVRPQGVEYNIGAWESVIDLGGNKIRAMVMA